MAASDVIRLTREGLRAQADWAPLPLEIEHRWRARFGARLVDEVRGCTRSLLATDTAPLPLHLPVVGGDGMRVDADAVGRLRRRVHEDDQDLAALLSGVTVRFAMDLESGTKLSAPMVTFLTPLRGQGCLVKDLPVRTGVAPEALGSALSFLSLRDLAVVAPDPQSQRLRRARLTDRGERAERRCRHLLGQVERDWRQKYGSTLIDRLRDALGLLLDHETGGHSTMAACLSAPPGGWRSRAPYARRLEAMISDPRRGLPRYPVVTHRGGFPDGS